MKRHYESLQDWLERTGTPQYILAKMARINTTSLSRLLTGSRRCSLEFALRLHEVTGVPVEKLVVWSALRHEHKTKRSFKRGRNNAA